MADMVNTSQLVQDCPCSVVNTRTMQKMAFSERQFQMLPLCPNTSSDSRQSVNAQPPSRILEYSDLL